MLITSTFINLKIAAQFVYVTLDTMHASVVVFYGFLAINRNAPSTPCI